MVFDEVKGFREKSIFFLCCKNASFPVIQAKLERLFSPPLSEYNPDFYAREVLRFNFSIFSRNKFYKSFTMISRFEQDKLERS
jgi:hypothetical protein